LNFVKADTQNYNPKHHVEVESRCMRETFLNQLIF